MAGKSSSDKTEQPTPKRIRDARKKGQVAKSNEAGSVAALVAVVLCFRAASDAFIEDIEKLFMWMTYLEQAAFPDILAQVGRIGATLLVKISLMVAGVAALAALIINFLQVCPLLSFEAIQPKLSKLNPAQKIKKLFSKDTVVELAKSVVKILLLGAILVMAIYHNIPNLFSLIDCDLSCILPVTGAVLNNIMVYTLLVYVTVAAIDLFLSRRKHIKELMMTKEEVKREFKESEGDPHIKGKRKQFFSEIVNSQQVRNVKRSSVVITNPTHVAIGLFYEEEDTPLPVVTFKAEGALAKRLVKVAEQEGVPVMQNVPLAHSLLEQSRVEQYIPRDLIKPVAEVLRVIRDLR